MRLLGCLCHVIKATSSVDVHNQDLTHSGTVKVSSDHHFLKPTTAATFGAKFSSLQLLQPQRWSWISYGLGGLYLHDFYVHSSLGLIFRIKLYALLFVCFFEENGKRFAVIFIRRRKKIKRYKHTYNPTQLKLFQPTDNCKKRKQRAPCKERSENTSKTGKQWKHMHSQNIFHYRFNQINLASQMLLYFILNLVKVE